MSIQITDSVLVGNMGDGWKDDFEAASAYASYLSAAYRAAAAERFPGADINVDVHVQNAYGWCRDVQVIGDGDDVGIGEFERDLADGRYWETWVNSDDAAQYVIDD